MLGNLLSTPPIFIDSRVGNDLIFQLTESRRHSTANCNDWSILQFRYLNPEGPRQPYWGFYYNNRVGNWYNLFDVSSSRVYCLWWRALVEWREPWGLAAIGHGEMRKWFVCQRHVSRTLRGLQMLVSEKLWFRLLTTVMGSWIKCEVLVWTLVFSLSFTHETKCVSSRWSVYAHLHHQPFLIKFVSTRNSRSRTWVFFW